jgi:hypothetical protein
MDSQPSQPSHSQERHLGNQVVWPVAVPEGEQTVEAGVDHLHTAYCNRSPGSGQRHCKVGCSEKAKLRNMPGAHERSWTDSRDQESGGSS